MPELVQALEPPQVISVVAETREHNLGWRVLGLIYCGLQAVQMFHTKAKIYEKKVAA
jgi:hypothetical protein